MPSLIGDSAFKECFNETNSTHIVSEISEVSDVDEDQISISVETDDLGRIVHILVLVSDPHDADDIVNAVNECAALNRNESQNTI